MKPKKIKRLRKLITKDRKCYLNSRVRKFTLFYESSLADYKVFEDERDYKFALIYLRKVRWYTRKFNEEYGK